MAHETEEHYDESSSGAANPDLAQALGGGSEEPYFAEEKKPANRSVMILLGVALAGLIVVYFMYFRKGPESAEAAAQANTADQTINQFLSDGTRNIQQMEQMLRETERVVEQFRTYPSMAQRPLSDLRTNPFRFHDETGVPADGEIARRKREEERAAALKAVSALSLQSIMHSGAHKACMINNQLCREGQQVNEFTIDRISPDSVIVRTGAYRFELKMQ